MSFGQWAGRLRGPGQRRGDTAKRDGASCTANTPLQFAERLNRAFEAGFRTGQKPVTAEIATHRWSASATTHLGVDHLFYGHGSPGQRCTSVVTCANPRSESSSLYTDGSLGWCDTTEISAANRPGPIDQTCRSTTRVS